MQFFLSHLLIETNFNFNFSLKRARPTQPMSTPTVFVRDGLGFKNLDSTLSEVDSAKLDVTSLSWIEYSSSPLP